MIDLEDTPPHYMVFPNYEESVLGLGEEQSSPEVGSNCWKVDMPLDPREVVTVHKALGHTDPHMNHLLFHLRILDIALERNHYND